MFEWVVCKGVYKGLFNLMWIGIGGGFDGFNLFNFFNFIYCVLDGCMLMVELLFKNVFFFNMMVMVMGLYLCCGIEDMIIDQYGNCMIFVQQIEQCVCVVYELGCEIVSGKEVCVIYCIGV